MALPAPAQEPAHAEGKISYSGVGSATSKALKKKHSDPRDSDIPGNLVSDVDALVRELMQKQPIPGLTVAVVRKGEVVLSRGYGKADVENNVPALPMSEFRTASIAKPMTAVAAMKLVQEGKLDLDAPVQRYCPAFPEKTSPDGKPWMVTTRELLSHRSGIGWYPSMAEQQNTRHYGGITESVKHFGGIPLEFEPETRSRYSSYGYVVVGCVIEGVTHESYFDYLRQEVLEPAEMESTVQDDPRKIVLHRVRGYELGQEGKGPLENAPYFDSSDRVPAGGLLSTADDVVRFAAAVMQEKLVSADTLKLMWTPVAPLDSNDPNAPPYGLGWSLMQLDGQRMVGHDGGQVGTSTLLRMLPDQDVAVAVMSNLEGAKLDDFANALLRLYARPD